MMSTEKKKNPKKTHRESNTKAAKTIIDVYNEVRRVFAKLDISTHDEKSESKSKHPDTTDMPELESEESAKQRKNKQGQGLKILTPKQMIIRLPIFLAQIKAGNNSEKLKNEIRQIVYSLYRSKNLSKTIYNNLINTIKKWRQYS